MTGKENLNVNPFIDYMEKNNIKMTRQNYLDLTMPDREEDIGAELESEIPPQFQNGAEQSKYKVNVVRKSK
jgi:hypothetical protein